MNLMLRRRGFLATGTGALAAWMTSAGARAAEAGAGKRVGLIGCGWYGKCDLLRLLQVAPVEVAALCDVDRGLLDEAGGLVSSRQVSKKTPRLFTDYREMLSGKDLDLVIVGTPDHWHALTAIAAMEAGADLYLQKPISVDVPEGKAILDTARRLGRVVQVGTQRRSTPHLVEAKERYVDSGALGKVGHVELFSYYHMRAKGNPPDEAPPPGLDWDFWCGPAPLRPFNKAIHPRGWRSFKEYGNGIAGDMCIHMLDTARWMLGLGWGLAAVLGAIAGMLTAPTSFLDPNMMQSVLIYAFAAAVLGGIDSPVGAVVGGLVLGVGLNLLGTYVYQLGTGKGDFGTASAVSILILGLTIALSWYYVRSLMKEES